MKARIILLVGLFFAGILPTWRGISQADNFQEFTYDSRGRRDPFAPLIRGKGETEEVPVAKAFGQFRLEGIIYDPGGSLAVINGKVLREGDVITGYKVRQIQKTSVSLSKEGESFTLNLKKLEKK